MRTLSGQFLPDCMSRDASFGDSLLKCCLYRVSTWMTGNPRTHRVTQAFSMRQWVWKVSFIDNHSAAGRALWIGIPLATRRQTSTESGKSSEQSQQLDLADFAHYGY